MSEIGNQKPIGEEKEEETSKAFTLKTWPDIEEDFVIPDVLHSEGVKKLHMSIQSDWDYLQKSACQTAAGRALWKHVIHDPLAHLFAGETHLRNLHTKIQTDRLNNAREISGVILAVRTLWFDTRIQAALGSFQSDTTQVVLLGAGMDARSYRLDCLNKSNVFEVDFPDVLQTKASLVQAAVKSRDELMMTAKSLVRVAVDIRDNDWFKQLKKSGFLPDINTVWVLEGILYYLSYTEAMQVLKLIAEKCAVTSTVLLADFMNKPSATLPNSVFHFYSDWPDQLLPTLGFSHVTLSQIGDPDANFGLLHDPQNLFNKLLRLPRTTQIHPDDGTPCCRLYLVEASGSPPQDNTFENHAEAIMQRIPDDDNTHENKSTLLVTCDQVVVYENAVREKPSGAEEAREYIRGYSKGHTATVSSVVVTNLKTGFRKGGVDRVEIYFNEIPEGTIEKLIEEGMVLKVAGALLIEHPLILPCVKEVVGTTDSVMGLPKELTEKLLKEVLAST